MAAAELRDGEKVARLRGRRFARLVCLIFGHCYSTKYGVSAHVAAMSTCARCEETLIVRPVGWDR